MCVVIPRPKNPSATSPLIYYSELCIMAIHVTKLITMIPSDLIISLCKEPYTWELLLTWLNSINEDTLDMYVEFSVFVK